MRMVRLIETFPIKAAMRPDILMRHSRHRLVEKHDLGIERERGCNFEGALASIGKLSCGRFRELS